MSDTNPIKVSFGRRVVAQVVDSLSVFIGLVIFQRLVFGGLNLILNGIQGQDWTWQERFQGPMVGQIFFGFYLAVLFFYNVYFHFEFQATPGKRLFGIRVTDLKGGSPSLHAVIKRTVWSGVSYLFLNIGYWMALFRKDGATLHELMSDTRTRYRL